MNNNINMGEVKEVPIMSEKDFEKVIKEDLNLRYFECVRQYRSVKRAYKRGHITSYGYMIPNRPFNNRKCTLGRSVNIQKKRIWEKMTGKKILW